METRSVRTTRRIARRVGLLSVGGLILGSSGLIAASAAPVGRSATSAPVMQAAPSATLLIGSAAPNGSAEVLYADGAADRTVKSSVEAPIGVAATPSGDIYLAGHNFVDGSLDFEIDRVTPTGAQTTVAKNLAVPFQIAVNPAGDVISTAGNAGAGATETPGTGNGPSSPVGAGLNGPEGVTVGSNGDIYIADSGNENVAEISGTTQTTSAPVVPAPGAIAVNAAGDVFVSQDETSSLTEIAPDGTQTRFGSGLSTVVGVATDPAGDVYVAEYDTRQILELSPAGSLVWETTDAEEPGEIAVVPGRAPSAPAVTVHTGTKSTATVSWKTETGTDPVTSNEVTATNLTTRSAPVRNASGTRSVKFTTLVNGDRYRFAIAATDIAGATSSTATATVGQPAKITGKPAAATKTTRYRFRFTLSGAPTPKVTRVAGKLPRGLRLTTAGLLTGRPTSAGRFTFTVEATNHIEAAATDRVTLVVRT